MTERLTTDNPSGNLQTMLNLAYAKDGEVWLRGEKDIELLELLKSLCNRPETGCNVTETGIEAAELYTDCLMEDEPCAMALLFAIATQAAELRARLKQYEDLGTVEELAEMVEAHEDGRAPILPCKVGDTVWVSPNCGKSLHTGKLYGKNERGAYLVFVDDSECHNVQNPVGRAFYDWFAKVYNREEAEAALKESKA